MQQNENQNIPFILTPISDHKVIGYFYFLNRFATHFDLYLFVFRRYPRLPVYRVFQVPWTSRNGRVRDLKTEKKRKNERSPQINCLALGPCDVCLNGTKIKSGRVMAPPILETHFRQIYMNGRQSRNATLKWEIPGEWEKRAQQFKWNNKI